jgi:hypothetical protein
MSITKGAVIKIVLKYIGGSPLAQIPTTTVGGAPVAAQLSGLVGAAAGVAAAVSSAATVAGSMAGGLSVLSQNPLASTISAAKSQVSGLTAGGFAGLATKLPNVAANPALSDSYDKLKVALGGTDGLSGAVAQVNKFEEHTNRLSGLLPSSDSTGNA